MIKEITSKIVCAVQKRGNVGKSTGLSTLGQWYEQRGIDWKGFDLDNDHQSLYRLFPDNVALHCLSEEPEGDLIRLFQKCEQNSVSVCDPRAHLTDIIIRTWFSTRFLRLFAEQGGNVTVLLYPADDLEIMSDLDGIVASLQDNVSYIVVKNRAKARQTRMYDGSELATELHRLGATEIEIPVLLSQARNRIAALEAQHGRGITHIEAIANKELELDQMTRFVVEDWIKGIFRQFDEIKTH
jgi:hypothetical protein